MRRLWKDTKTRLPTRCLFRPTVGVTRTHWSWTDTPPERNSSAPYVAHQETVFEVSLGWKVFVFARVSREGGDVRFSSLVSEDSQRSTVQTNPPFNYSSPSSLPPSPLGVPSTRTLEVPENDEESPVDGKWKGDGSWTVFPGGIPTRGSECSYGLTLRLLPKDTFTEDLPIDRTREGFRAYRL